MAEFVEIVRLPWRQQFGEQIHWNSSRDHGWGFRRVFVSIALCGCLCGWRESWAPET